uniref:Transmembrane domain-containing protein n=1 Tax=Parastrongyloides trichosuri TaxID=131310 RepID=A0A0N4ZK02_PARTI
MASKENGGNKHRCCCACGALFIWFVVTTLALFFFVYPYVGFVKDRMDDVSSFQDKASNIMNIVNDLKEFMGSISEVQGNISNSDFWREKLMSSSIKFNNLSDAFIRRETKEKILDFTNKYNFKKINDLVDKYTALNKEFDELVAANKTEELIEFRIKNEEDLEKGKEYLEMKEEAMKEIKNIESEVKKDIETSNEKYKKKGEMFKDIDYLFNLEKETITKLKEDFSKLTNDINILEIKLPNNIKLDDIFKRLEEFIDFFVEFKKNVSSKLYPIFVSSIHKKNGVVKVNGNEVTDGIVVAIHSCYFIDHKFNVNGEEQGSQLSMPKMDFNTMKDLLLENHDTSVILKKDGTSGDEIEVCSSWGRNQATLYKVLIVVAIVLFVSYFLIIIFSCCNLCTGYKCAIVPVIFSVFMVICAIILMTVTYSSKPKQLSSEGEKYYLLTIPNYVDKWALGCVWTLLIGYSLILLIFVYNLYVTQKGSSSKGGKLESGKNMKKSRRRESNKKSSRSSNSITSSSTTEN